MTSQRCLAKNEEVNDTTKEIKKHKKKQKITPILNPTNTRKQK